MVIVGVIFLRVYIFILVFYILGTSLLDQLFHSPLLNMRFLQPTRRVTSRWLFTISYPKSARGIILKQRSGNYRACTGAVSQSPTFRRIKHVRLFLSCFRNKQKMVFLCYLRKQYIFQIQRSCRTYSHFTLASVLLEIPRFRASPFPVLRPHSPVPSPQSPVPSSIPIPSWLLNSPFLILEIAFSVFLARDLVKSLPTDSFKNLYGYFGNKELKSLLGRELFPKEIFHSYYGGEQSELFVRKGVFPYEWFNNYSKLDENALPPKEEFYSKIKLEGISDEDYEHAQKVWKVFNCKKVRDYP